ncbi:MAG: hypothetical protein ICV62_12530 [Cyanobacteria bacterium Co-bin13]|nr:hypothetical protein [Cyanobacteria bacterium Co-bin13]
MTLLIRNSLQAGLKVKIYYPDYVSGETGVILTQEVERDGSATGYWLVQVLETDIVVALLPEECAPLA